MKYFTFVFLFLLLLINLVNESLHLTRVPVPNGLREVNHGSSRFFPKKEMGVNNIVLFGDDLQRGYDFGTLTKNLLLRQEDALNESLSTFMPMWVRNLIILVAANYYQGMEKEILPRHLREMYGVSLSAPEKYKYLADPYSRQVALHGLHEIGQTMVDSDLVPFACTLLAAQSKGNWFLSRNFDFEGGRIFDDEKIVKWVFPESGYPYVSVIWAGMVGAVTGVNSNGVYISINAAGTDDRRRIGTPTTLILTEALELAETAEEAIQIISKRNSMISDIFVVLDSNSQKLYRVEKSTRMTYSQPEQKFAAIANHFVGEVWKNDKTNESRKRKLTTLSRERRGRELLTSINWNQLRSSQVTTKLAQLARDKTPYGATEPILGHRGAIDALIATHSVIYNSKDGILFVSTGPSLSGEFIGFDLTKSFEQKKPVVVDRIPGDPIVSEADYIQVKIETNRVQKDLVSLALGDCPDETSGNDSFPKTYNHPNVYRVKGDLLSKCQGDLVHAKNFWELALKSPPEYEKDKDYLVERLK
ncbi:MAG: hypothetical protein KDD25_01135 [Bdellovibrionales bacterium]|nr:hypothetical protein [Bdellovibrionales bacterium]